MSVYDFADPFAWAALASIAAGTWLLWRIGRGTPTGTGTPVRFRPGLYLAGSWQPPAPIFEAEPAPVAWTPPYAELTVAASLRKFGDSPEDIARRFLAEAAAEQRKAVA